MLIPRNKIHDRVYSIRPLITALLLFSLLLRFYFYNPPPIYKGSCPEISGRIISVSKTGSNQKLLVSSLLCVGRELEGALQVKTRMFPLFSIGDTVTFSAELKEPPRYLQLRGISAMVEYPDLEKNKQVVKPADKVLSTNYVRERIFRLRNSLVSTCKKILPEPHASLLAGILFGSSNIPPDFAQALKKSGTTHIVVASGFNFIVVISALTTIALLLGKVGALSFSIFGIAFYALLVGANPPVLRAAVMSFLAFLGRFFQRQPDSGFALLFSSVILLHINPALLWNVSFQLTFFATLGIVYLAPFFRQCLQFVPKNFRDVFTETWSAQLSTYPVLLLQFGQAFSLTSLFCNLLIVSAVPFVTWLGFLSVFLYYIKPVLGRTAAFLLYPSLAYIVSLVNLFG